MSLDDLFPKAQGKPVTVKALYPEVKQIRSYSQGYKIKWLNSDRPQPTIGKDHAQKPTRWRINNTEHRPTTEQLRVVSSFPRQYKFTGNDNDAWGRIGNSVPPLFMYAIAAQIRYIMFNGPGIEARMNDYPAHLDAMWQKANAPREANAPTVISTFAGGGGSLTGYLMAGYRDLLAVEWDDNAVATLRANYPELDIYHGDIAKLTVDEVLERTGLKPGDLDILDGSPPCQGFSTAGKRVMDDPRNQLFREYVRLLRGLRPKVFVMENVSGMAKGKMKLIFVEILKELKGSGYRVSAKLLNAMYFHVPQSRERMIFIGVRDDLDIEPSHPGAESRPVTVGEAWVNVPYNDPPRLSPKLASIIPDIPVWGDGGDVTGSFFSTKRLSFKHPSRTLIKGNIGSRACYVHPAEDRAITGAEIRRIAAFSDDYVMPGNYKNLMERIGNSVPPLFMEAIARHIRVEILARVAA